MGNICSCIQTKDKDVSSKDVNQKEINKQKSLPNNEAKEDKHHNKEKNGSPRSKPNDDTNDVTEQSNSEETSQEKKHKANLKVAELVNQRNHPEQGGKPDLGEVSQQQAKMNPKKFSELYVMGKKIGQGGYSIVKKGCERATGTVYAIKIMDLPKETQYIAPNASSREDIFKEIEIATQMVHPNIVTLKEYFIEEYTVYLVMELLEGGELLDAVLNMGVYTETDAKIIFRQMMEAIKYLHSYNVVHRDLKLENFLLVRKGDISRIKLADFGLAKMLAWGTMETVCGTPNYVAPEILQVGAQKESFYSPKVDVWSAGVILYILLAGEPPFRDVNESMIFKRIRRYQYNLTDDLWQRVSDDAKDLIRHILCPPDKRYDAAQALEHPWLHISEQVWDQVRKQSMEDEYQITDEYGNLPDGQTNLHSEASLRDPGQSQRAKEAKQKQDANIEAQYSNKFGMRHQSLKFTQKKLKSRRLWRRAIGQVIVASVLLEHFKQHDKAHLIEQYFFDHKVQNWDPQKNSGLSAISEGSSQEKMKQQQSSSTKE